MFDGTVFAKGMETKDSKEIVRTFSTMFSKKNCRKKVWVDNGTDFEGEFQKNCDAEGLQTDSKTSEIIAAFAHCTLRSIKGFFTVTWKSMGTSTITSHRDLSQLWLLERIFWLIWKQKLSQKRTFWPFSTANVSESTENHYVQLEVEFASESIICHSESLISQKIRQKKLVSSFDSYQKTTCIHKNKMIKLRL